MSNFRDEMKRSTPTPQQMSEREQTKRDELLKLEEQSIIEKANRYCYSIREYLRFLAKIGDYELIGDVRVIKGYCHEESNEFVHISKNKTPSIEPYAYPFNDHSSLCRYLIPKSDSKWSNKMYTYNTDYFKTSFWSYAHKWSATFALTPFAQRTFALVQDILKKDGIEFRHAWIVHKFKRKSNAYGKYDTISCDSVYSEQITVKQTFQDVVSVIHVCEYEFRY